MSEFDIDPVSIGAVVSGRYTIADKLGEGGMGVLYRATDSEVGGRTVVLKFPKKELLYRKGFRERFQREIESLVQFDHPHVVRVYGVGEYERTPFVVLQYLAGGSLESKIQQKRLVPEEVLKWLPDLAATLDSLHQRGIIHRDVKAGNILFDAYGEVYLSDFGIVKVLSEIEQGTSTGGPLGSPESLAPEAVSNLPASPAYDQYGLATSVYQSICGELPFGSTNVIELLARITHEPPEPLIELAENVGQDFSNAVMKALSKNPQHRFVNCTEFAHALERAMKNVGAETEQPRDALLEVRCTVVGAVVVVDGVYKGQAPVTIRLPKGPHIVQLQKIRYETFERRIDVQHEQSIEAVLIRHAIKFTRRTVLVVSAAGALALGTIGLWRFRVFPLARARTLRGSVSTLAGSPLQRGFSDGIGSAARFDSPVGIAVDLAGNIFVADLGNHTVRKITPTGVVSTFAGLAGESGSEDGVGSAARFDNPNSVAVDSSRNVFVSDMGNCTIRKITPDGVVSTFAGLAGQAGSVDGVGDVARFNAPVGLAMDAERNLFLADRENCTIRKISPAGVVSTFAGLAGQSGFQDGIGSTARFRGLEGVAVDASGNIYVADYQDGTVRKISPAGIVSTLAGVAGAQDGSVDGVGNSARFVSPTGIATDAAGNVYVADSDNCTIRKINSAGAVSTVAGDPGRTGYTDGSGSFAGFDRPSGLATDAAGCVYVSDYGSSTIRKIV